MLKLYGQGTSCNYAMCTNAGHASCAVVVQHYNRLCAAAQAVLEDPTGSGDQALRDGLQAVLEEQTGLEG